jgi:cephalosporin-C deacetylase-like acetyl esterase
VKADLGLFAYDASQPVRLDVVARHEQEGVPVCEIRFHDGAGGEVEAFVVGEADRPGVVIAHGGTGPGKHIFVGEAVALANRGFVVLLADTSYPLDGTREERVEAQRIRVLTQRRGLDVLTAEYGAARLGFYGHSAGGAVGGCLAAVEPRLTAIVVAAARGGHARWARDEGITDPAELDAFDRLDPEHFVAVPGTRELLFQFGLHDDVIPYREARALYEAAAEPKTWSEYDCGHGIDGHAPARAERLEFFERALGLS